MVDQIQAFLKKHWDALIYLFFGVLTTLVNYAVYAPLHNLLALPAAVCNVAAWVVSVVFAYLTNKPFVFHSHDWSKEVVQTEFGKFAACRLLSGAFETGLLYITVDCLYWDGNIMKLLASVIVVIVNYIGSKILIFRKKTA